VHHAFNLEPGFLVCLHRPFAGAEHAEPKAQQVQIIKDEPDRKLDGIGAKSFASALLAPEADDELGRPVRGECRPAPLTSF
jgi:hypothetical protein